MQIRLATLADLPAFVQIYNAAIPGRQATADTEPVTLWTVDSSGLGSRPVEPPLVGATASPPGGCCRELRNWTSENVI